MAIQIFRNCHQSLKNPYRLTTIQELYFYCSLGVCELWLTPQSESLLFCLYFFLRRKGEERSWGATTHYCTTSTRTTDSCTHTRKHTQCIVSTSKPGTLIPQMQLQHQHPPLYCATCICLNSSLLMNLIHVKLIYSNGAFSDHLQKLNILTHFKNIFVIKHCNQSMLQEVIFIMLWQINVWCCYFTWSNKTLPSNSWAVSQLK